MDIVDLTLQDEPGDELVEKTESDNPVLEMAKKYSDANKYRLRVAKIHRYVATVSELSFSSDSDNDNNIPVQDNPQKDMHTSGRPKRSRWEPVTCQRDSSAPTTARWSPKPGPSHRDPYSDFPQVSHELATPASTPSSEDFYWQQPSCSHHHMSLQDRSYTPSGYQDWNAGVNHQTEWQYTTSENTEISINQQPGQQQSTTSVESEIGFHQQPGQQESTTSVESEIGFHQQPVTSGQTGYGHVKVPLQLLNPSTLMSLRTRLLGVNTTLTTPKVTPYPMAAPPLAIESQVAPGPPVCPNTPNPTVDREPPAVSVPGTSVGPYHPSMRSPAEIAESYSDINTGTSTLHDQQNMTSAAYVRRMLASSRYYNTENNYSDFNNLADRGQPTSVIKSSWTADNFNSLPDLCRISTPAPPPPAASHPSGMTYSQRNFVGPRPARTRWEMSTPPLRSSQDLISSLLMPPPQRPLYYLCHVCGKKWKSYSGLRTHLRMKCEKDTYKNSTSQYCSLIRK